MTPILDQGAMDSGQARRRRRLLNWSGPVSIAVLFLALLRWTWLKWPDPIVDFGLNMYRGWQLAAGKLLYKEIYLPFGPLSHCIVAGWFKLAGVSLRSMIWLNLSVLALIVVLLHRLLSVIAGRLAAAAGGLVFVAIFAFGQYTMTGNYNYVCPYTEEATHGMAISLAAILLVRRAGSAANRGAVGALGGCLGLLVLIKPEYFAAVLAGVTAGLGAMLLARRAGKPEWLRTSAVLAVAAAVPVAAAWAWLAFPLGPAAALSGVFRAWSSIAESGLAGKKLYLNWFGFDDVGASLLECLRMLGYHAALLVPVILIARRCRPGLRGQWIGLGIGSVVSVVLWTNVPQNKWLEFVRPFPFEVAAITAWAGWRVWRDRADGEDPAVSGTRLAAGVFAVALLAKMLLNTRVYHYGFVLAVPAAMLVVSSLLAWIPSWMERVGGSAVLLRCFAGVILATYTLAHLRIEQSVMSEKIYVVGSGSDRFLADHRGRYLNDAVAVLLAVTPARSRVFVVPEGPFVNYLARRESPGLIHGFLPNGLTDESSVIGMLESELPEAVVITNRTMNEFGVLPFGYGYGRELLAWINRRYVSERQLGPSPMMPGGDGISILLRRPDPRPGAPGQEPGKPPGG